MTIGIGAYGPSAGAAVLAAWAEVERQSAGEVGGFAVFAAILSGGPLTLECQRGGLQCIRSEWVENGVLGLMAQAQVAGVITSGPDRAVPLSQYLAVGQSGLVTGHRRPDHAGEDGVPLNIAALRLLEAGKAPDLALAQVIDPSPEVDAGLIAVSHDALALRETVRVMRRMDRGQAMLQGPSWGLAVLHNSIQPQQGLAEKVARAGMAVFS
ncbi:DUF6963 family protein [Cypionkella psychrotolerans]|uniref:DUF6963 family protein n=1 Tax=Cypionkella psychrotolerans TaxID=1678131 RepID=UPI0006B59494|nr:hypothetical protein [Cypionkella psychrotolerans]